MQRTAWLVLLLFACAPHQQAQQGPGTCQGLTCQVPACPGGGDTTLSGRVTAPNGTDPIRGALIYVPEDGQVPALPATVGCELCQDASTGGPGRMSTHAYSGPDGRFVLKGVPATTGTPVIIQKGRFRRVLRLPVAACQARALDPGQTSLPGQRSQGDLPQIAVAVGDYDAIECVLRGMGIDPGEFVAPTQDGAVHLYDNQTPPAPGVPGPGAPGGVNVGDLLSDLPRMMKYNLIFLNCSGTTYSKALLLDSGSPVRRNLERYVAAGGRLYVTDWSYDFIEQVPQFSDFMCFNDNLSCSVPGPHGFNEATNPGHGGDPTPFTAQVNTAVDEGQALSSWLAGLSPPVLDGEVTIRDLQESWVLLRQTSLLPADPTVTWLRAQVQGAQRPLTVTFDYPAFAACGRVMYSSYHAREHTQPIAYPYYCPSGPLIDQEHVLEFLVFEIAGCIGAQPG